MNMSKANIVMGLKATMGAIKGYDDYIKAAIKLIGSMQEPDAPEFGVGWKGKTISGINVEIVAKVGNTLIGAMGVSPVAWSLDGKSFRGLNPNDAFIGDNNLTPDEPKTVTGTWWMVDAGSKEMFEEKSDAVMVGNDFRAEKGGKFEIHKCTITYEVQ